MYLITFSVTDKTNNTVDHLLTTCETLQNVKECIFDQTIYIIEKFPLHNLSINHREADGVEVFDYSEILLRQIAIVRLKIIDLFLHFLIVPSQPLVFLLLFHLYLYVQLFLHIYM